MSGSRKPRSGSGDRRTGPTTSPQERLRRPRPTPRWLVEKQDLDEVARRRCLLVLSVLSGERPVTDVIEEAQISRGTYYQLEERALNAMLLALVPGTMSPGAPGADLAARRIEELEARVTQLEQEKRRAERLLLLTRKVMKPGPVKAVQGRPAKSRTRPRSTSSGSESSTSSSGTAAVAVAASAATTTAARSALAPSSTPTPGGGAGR
jgi:hypothetical protein